MQKDAHAKSRLRSRASQQVSSVPHPLHAKSVRADRGRGNGVCVHGVYDDDVVGGGARGVGGVAVSIGLTGAILFLLFCSMLLEFADNRFGSGLAILAALMWIAST